jgi:hypothetical protein
VVLVGGQTAALDELGGHGAFLLRASFAPRT